ncbi:hypothetical protein ATCC51562_1837 [Campylobacter concisus ATCC 51562]|uniref:Uncharacterized protein n=1 Tax=Campylobacter concisus ATCC 51562 TaxID=1242969 RepID=U2ELY0_9BACT|nr:hypothetical protein ATCC51562_1837 [Campylobacter concisus ATCC 51562]
MWLKYDPPWHYALSINLSLLPDLPLLLEFSKFLAKKT